MQVVNKVLQLDFIHSLPFSLFCIVLDHKASSLGTPISLQGLYSYTCRIIYSALLVPFCFILQLSDCAPPAIKGTCTNNICYKFYLCLLSVFYLAPGFAHFSLFRLTLVSHKIILSYILFYWFNIFYLPQFCDRLFKYLTISTIGGSYTYLHPFWLLKSGMFGMLYFNQTMDKVQSTTIRMIYHCHSIL